jgi:hypothetical protein
MLRRLAFRAEDFVRTIYWNALLGRTENFPTPLMKELDEGIGDALPQDDRDRLWPDSHARWTGLLSPDGENELHAMLVNIQKALPRNHQHPLVRASPRHAAIAYRFTLVSLKPFLNEHTNGADRCQLCGAVGSCNNGFHLLTSCNHSKAYSVRRNLLPPEVIMWWREARENNDFNALNEFIIDQEPELENETEQVKKLLLIREGGNDLDILARLLQHYIRDRDADGNWTHEARMNRSGNIVRQVPRGKANSLTNFQILRADLDTAYNWIGHLVYELWLVYCRRKGNAEEELV